MQTQTHKHTLPVPCTTHSTQNSHSHAVCTLLSPSWLRPSAGPGGFIQGPDVCGICLSRDIVQGPVLGGVHFCQPRMWLSIIMKVKKVLQLPAWRESYRWQGFSGWFKRSDTNHSPWAFPEKNHSVSLLSRDFHCWVGPWKKRSSQGPCVGLQGAGLVGFWTRQTDQTQPAGGPSPCIPPVLSPSLSFSFGSLMTPQLVREEPKERSLAGRDSGDPTLQSTGPLSEPGGEMLPP